MTNRILADDIGSVHYVVAGSPRALGFGIADACICANCGARIAHVFMTDAGPIGGDCLASITGDNSTRAAVRALSNKLRAINFDSLCRFEVEARVDGGASLHATTTNRYRKLLGITKLDAQIAASVLGEALIAQSPYYAHHAVSIVSRAA